MELIEILPLLILVGIISGLIGGLMTGFVILYRLAPSFRRTVRQYRHHWSRHFNATTASIIRNHEGMVRFGYAVTAASMCAFLIWFSSALTSVPFHLDLVYSVVLLLESAIGIIVGSSIMIAGSSIGIVKMVIARKWR